MFRPRFVVRKTGRSISELLPWLFPHFHGELKRFVCFVAAENEELMVVGSGTITHSGVVTAAHLFHFPFTEATITFFVDDCHIVTIPINHITLDAEKDIAFCNVVVPSHIVPCSLPIAKMEVDAKKLLAFGCPQGVFGHSWRAKAISHNSDFIISRGVAIPGISGGGIYYKKNGKWFLLAVHSFAYLDSKTLYSRRLS